MKKIAIRLWLIGAIVLVNTSIFAVTADDVINELKKRGFNIKPGQETALKNEISSKINNPAVKKKTLEVLATMFEGATDKVTKTPPDIPGTTTEGEDAPPPPPPEDGPPPPPETSTTTTTTTTTTPKKPGKLKKCSISGDLNTPAGQLEALACTLSMLGEPEEEPETGGKEPKPEPIKKPEIPKFAYTFAAFKKDIADPKIVGTNEEGPVYKIKQEAGIFDKEVLPYLKNKNITSSALLKKEDFEKLAKDGTIVEVKGKVEIEKLQKDLEKTGTTKKPLPSGGKLTLAEELKKKLEKHKFVG